MTFSIYLRYKKEWFKEFFKDLIRNFKRFKTWYYIFFGVFLLYSLNWGNIILLNTNLFVVFIAFIGFVFVSTVIEFKSGRHMHWHRKKYKELGIQLEEKGDKNGDDRKETSDIEDSTK